MAQIRVLAAVVRCARRTCPNARVLKITKVQWVTNPKPDPGERAIKIEFVCSICLRSVFSSDLAPIPRCPCCGIKLTPDSDEPKTRYSSQRPLMIRRKPAA